MLKVATRAPMFAVAVWLQTQSVAIAQTTNCQWIGNVWSCNQPKQSQGVDWGAALRAGQEAVQPPRPQPQNQISPAEEEAIEQRRQAQKLRKKVGKLISAGSCEDARKAALEGGDFGLAMQVREICQAEGKRDEP